MDKDALVIVGMARTPIGGLLGELKDFSAWQLGAEAIKAAVSRSGVNPNEIQEVLMGCVLSAGLGQAPARQAAIHAGLPNSVSATTINKVCGSGMKSIMLANPELITVAGGMESMTNSPYLLLKARVGYRAGHAEQLKDHMFLDGLEDAYDRGKLMGVFAENTAKKYNISRQEQDAFALESLLRAQKSNFKAEISAIGLIERDELPQRAKPEKIPQLKPAFDPNGTVTAANSSSISDGAAAVVLMSESEAKRRKLKPIARIVGSATHSHDPAWFTTAPVEAIKKLLKKINWDINAVDLFEINEAFAVVTLFAMKELGLSHNKVNVHGGACALGHPIGASGARIVVTLISALQQHGLKRGIASLCIGGGEATALGVELC